MFRQFFDLFRPEGDGWDGGNEGADSDSGDENDNLVPGLGPDPGPEPEPEGDIQSVSVLKIYRGAICIDLDGVVVDLFSALQDRRRAENLTPLPTPVDYPMSNFSPADHAWCLRAFMDPIFYKKMRPYRDALVALHALANYYFLVFVTSRSWDSASKSHNDFIQQVTREWLLDFPEHKIVFCPSAEKGRWARHFYGETVHFAVEDSPYAAASYIEAGIPVYMISQPYNQGMPESKMLTYVPNLSGVLRDLEEAGVIAGRRALVYDNSTQALKRDYSN